MQAGGDGTAEPGPCLKVGGPHAFVQPRSGPHGDGEGQRLEEIGSCPGPFSVCIDIIRARQMDFSVI